MPRDLRGAQRAEVRLPVLVEKIGLQPVAVDAAIAPYFERVTPDPSDLGAQVPGIIIDLSVGGVFVAMPPWPLLSRLALSFALPGFGQIEAIGWVMWRRTADVLCESPSGDRSLAAGVGVLFEAMSLEGRQAIGQLVARTASSPP